MPREDTDSELIVVARALRTRGLKGEIVAEHVWDPSGEHIQLGEGVLPKRE